MKFTDRVKYNSLMSRGNHFFKKAYFLCLDFEPKKGYENYVKAGICYRDAAQVASKCKDEERTVKAQTSFNNCRSEIKMLKVCHAKEIGLGVFEEVELRCK